MSTVCDKSIEGPWEYGTKPLKSYKQKFSVSDILKMSP